MVRSQAKIVILFTVPLAIKYVHMISADLSVFSCQQSVKQRIVT
jgi:hypothetical protein